MTVQGDVRRAKQHIEGIDAFHTKNTEIETRSCYTLLLLAISWVILFTIVYSINWNDEIPSTESRYLIDAATRFFSNSSQVTSAGKSYSIHDRPDITSFAFDLGGTNCACQLRWDKKQYWQRLIYGNKNVVQHTVTPTLGSIFFHRITWTLLYKLLNEVLEEAHMVIFGNWAFAPISELETRYDSFINDILLSGLLFAALGYHFLWVLEFKDPFFYFDFDIDNMKRFFMIILPFWILNDVVNHVGFMFETRNYQFVMVGLVQISLIFIFKLPLESTDKQRFWMSILILSLWTLGAYGPSNKDSQLNAFFTWAVSGLVILTSQYYFTSKRHVLCIFMGLCYITALVTFFLLDNEIILDRPDDYFYYHTRWCGLSDKNTNSCAVLDENAV
ncbi:MAG: hypothetical protein HN793_07405 [Rhodospirillaceae bacterium]|nr:hypothetical protein [Rhodospirillaceae bacterium]